MVAAGERLAVVVERRDQRLAGAGWGDDQISEVSSVDSLRFKLVERSLLVRMRLQIEEHRRAGISATWTLTSIFKRLFHTTAKGFVVGPEFLEFLIAPKGIEGAPETLDNMGSFDFAELYGPLDSVFKSGSR